MRLGRRARRFCRFGSKPALTRRAERVRSAPNVRRRPARQGLGHHPPRCQGIERCFRSCGAQGATAPLADCPCDGRPGAGNPSLRLLTPKPTWQDVCCSVAIGGESGRDTDIAERAFLIHSGHVHRRKFRYARARCADCTSRSCSTPAVARNVKNSRGCRVISGRNECL